MKRRILIKVGVLGLISSCAINNKYQHNKSIEDVSERSDVSINESFDVIVCGGGPAGIAAAISAARTGAKTCLIELYGCLGGIWTTGLLSNIIDYDNKAGIMAEIIDRLKISDAQISAKIFDSEVMKLILDQLCMEAGVYVRLYTRVVSASKKGRRLISIITESNSGREIWYAKCFVDATGNGDLAARAGCNFELGHPDSGKTQPMSLMGIVSGVNQKDIVGSFLNKNASNPQNKENLRKEIEKLGFSPSYAIPTLLAIRPNLMALMTNHEYGVSALNAQQLSDATIRARAEINKIVNGLRSLGGVWKNIRLVATGSQIGIREGRRIKGRYYLTKEDILNGAKFDDAVCHVNYMADIHSLDHDEKGYTTDGIVVKSYDIPLRSLIAKDVDGLIMAGRCISGDFFAHASYRVTGNAVVMGEAAGTLAALASMDDRLPHEVEFDNVKKLLCY